MIDRFKPSLLKCFSLVASIRANPEDRETCYALQEYLVSKITYVERKLKNAKNAIKELKSALATERAFSRDKAQLLKEYIRYLNYKIDVYQNVLHIYRDVGDAIAYTYVDRWDLKPTSFKEGPGFISAKRGARLERAIFRRTRSQLRPGIIMILNDVTNCLRYGDLTLVGDGRILRIIEAKSGKSKKFNKRGKRQQEKIELLLKYLETDRATGLYEEVEVEVRRVVIYSELKTNVEDINSMIRSIDKEKILVREVKNGLFYYVAALDHSNVDRMVDLIGLKEHDVIISLVNQFKYKNNGHYPFTLSIDQPHDVYRFYAEQIIVSVAVDFLTLKKKIEREGYTFTYGGSWPATIRDEKTGAEVRIGPHIFS